MAYYGNNFWIPQKVENFFASWATINFSTELYSIRQNEIIVENI